MYLNLGEPQVQLRQDMTGLGRRLGKGASANCKKTCRASQSLAAHAPPFAVDN